MAQSEEVTEKYAITTPLQVIDLLALMGDSADNFPGCPGVGEKTAAKLINDFGSVANLIAHSSEVKGKLREKVEEHVDDIKMSYFLATIKTDVPVELNMDALKLVEPNEEELGKIFTELEFKSLADRILKKNQKPQKIVSAQLDLFGEFPADGTDLSENSSFDTLKTTPHDYKLVENEDDLRKLCDFFRTKQILSLDTETTSTPPIEAELVGLSFAVKEFEAFYVPIPANREEALRIVHIFKGI